MSCTGARLQAVLLMAGATAGLVVYLLSGDLAALAICALFAARACFYADEGV